MSTEKTLAIKSTSGEQTEKLASQIGAKLRGGEVIELVSDLGGGKTTFVRGLASGMGSKDKVASPSFTISRIYKTPKLELHHLDLYRLDLPGLMAHELNDVLGDPNVVVVVEWGDVVHEVLPSDRLVIKIQNQSDDSRLLNFSCPSPLAYLIEGLC